MVKRKEAVNMKLQSITEKQIQKFRKYLVNEEKSDATIEKFHARKESFNIKNA